MPIHERLRYARERVGRTLQQVEERTGIGTSSLSAYENGHREPSFAQLKALAEIYHRPVAFFFEEGDVPQELVLWRERPPSPVAEETEARLLELCRQYHHLEVWSEEASLGCLPRFPVQADRFGRDDVRRLAHETRAVLGVGERPGQSLLCALENSAGVKVFHLAFEPRGGGASTVSPTFGPAVLLNAKDSSAKRTVSLAHELFHLLTWEVFRAISPTADEREERLADWFARDLLMPDLPLQLAFGARWHEGRATFREVADVARQFRVTSEDVLQRLSDIGGRSEEDVRKDVVRYRALGLKDEMEETEAAPSRPERFQKLAVRAYNEGELSLGRLAEYLGVSRGEATERYAREAEARWDHDEVLLRPR